MSDIPANEIKILIAASGGRCAFPGCGKLLVTESPHGAGSQGRRETFSLVYRRPHPSDIRQLGLFQEISY